MKTNQLVLLIGIAAVALPAGLAQPPSSAVAPVEALKVKLEPFEVTGSHLKRIDYETPVPVLTFSIDAIEQRGYATLGEFLDSLSFNSGNANYEFTTGSFITTAATINPRGLGSNRVLTLVDGRRTVPFALTNSVNGTAASNFNFSSIPFSAIESADFQKDGGSAIYGSDAITGVVNIKLKKNYNGSALDFSFQNSLRHDSLVRRLSAVTGTSRDRWSIFLGVSHQVKHSNMLPDLGVASTDFRYLGAKGAAYLSPANNPSYLRLTAAQASESGVGTAAGIYVVRGAVPTANPAKSNFAFVGPTLDINTFPAVNNYDPGKDTQLTPDSEASGAFGNASLRLTPAITAFTQFTLNRSTTYRTSTPLIYTTTIGGMTFPAGNPYNPLGITLTQSGSNAVFAVMNSDSRVHNATYNGSFSTLAGLRGTALRIWDWETAVSFGVDRVTQTRNAVRAADLQAVLNGTTRETAFNLFGPSDNPHVLTDRVVRSIYLDNRIEGFEYTARAAAHVWQIPLRSAGELGVATGYEFRQDTTHSHPDQAAYIGYTNGVPFHGQRQAHSVYLEFSVPLQKWLELQLAGRHEHYSDFGETTNPKFSTLLRLPKNQFVNLAIRGSYSESFKAPDLGQLYQKQTSAISIGTFIDPLRPQDGARNIRSILGGNPDLKPELGKVQYTGFIVELPWFKGLSLTADYVDIKIRNVITTLSPGFLLSADGRRQYPNAVVRDNSVSNPGPVLFVYGISQNAAFQLARNWDYGLRYDRPTQRFGRFNFSADVTQVVFRGTDSGQGGGLTNNRGRYYAPIWRSNLALSWRYKTVGAAVTADVIGKWRNRSFTTAAYPAGWGENVWTSMTTSFTYRGFNKTSLTIGSNNVLDHRPPPNAVASIYGFDDRISSAGGAVGRTFFLRGRREF